MKILVIGGSYFLGRVYTMLAAKEHEVTVLNRGTYSMQEFGASCLRADRRDENALRSLKLDGYDVVVDFCAYRQGDVETLVSALACVPKQYLLISTADVYEKWTGRVLTEESALCLQRFGGENGTYIWQKILLEKELLECCGRSSMAPTIVRPALMYGPFNYALRESVYVRLACAGKEWLCPVGAPGRFQPVYVKDAAAILLRLTGQKSAFGEAYNLAGEQTDYEGFLEAMADASHGIARICRAAYSSPVFADPETFLPFPLTREETEFYDGGKALRATGLKLTPLSEGAVKTWNAFYGVYGRS